MSEPKDKAAEEYAPKYDGTTCSSTRVSAFRNGFLAGADWQAQQGAMSVYEVGQLLGACVIERDQLKRELNDAKILLEATRNESVQERVIAELKAESDRYRDIADKMAGALENLKPMIAMYSHQTFREGKDGPMKTELMPTYSGELITKALAEYAAMKEEME